jgi:hypothetical protein
MTNPNQTPAPQDLDETSLDLVAGAGVMVPDLARKQEQEDKLTAGGKA